MHLKNEEIAPGGNTLSSLLQGLSTRFVVFDKPTSTCFEKARLLQRKFPDDGWVPSRVVKAMYGVLGDDQLYCFILPELGYDSNQGRRQGKRSRVSRKRRRRKLEIGNVTSQVVQRVLTKTRLSEGIDDFTICFPDDCLPAYMERGTCTPFIQEECLRDFSDCDYFKAIFIHDDPTLDGKMVDVSVGGIGKEFHRVSLHLPYRLIHETLQQRFPGHVYKVDFFC